MDRAQLAVLAGEGLEQVLVVLGLDVPDDLAVPIQGGDLHHAAGRAVFRGQVLAILAVAHHLVNITGLGGGGVRRHGDGGGAIAAQIVGAGLGGQQAAVLAHGDLGQAGAAVEILVLQPVVDAAHDLAPQNGGGVAQGLGEPLVGLIARPHGGAVIGGEAREIAVAVFVGGTGPRRRYRW